MTNSADEKQRGTDNAVQLLHEHVARAANIYVHFVDKGGLDLTLTEEHKAAYERLKDAVLAMRVVLHV